MNRIFDKKELELRIERFKKNMDRFSPNWQMCIIVSKINLFYFTGTRQNGMLVITKEGKPVFWVKRVYSRAIEESDFTNIFPMNSFKDAAEYYDDIPKTVYVERSKMTLDRLDFIKKHFKFENIEGLDNQLNYSRSIKTEKELKLMEKSGKIHSHILQKIVPGLLYEGISEKNFFGKLYFEALKAGYQGVSRFGNYECDCFFGQVGFGENSMVPTSFDSPGGQKGLSPAVPAIGDEKKILKSGDLVFVDLGVAYSGYHTDATMTYVFDGKIDDKAEKLHEKCVWIRNEVAKRLVPGQIPSEIYRDVISDLDDDFKSYFMGTKGNQVAFLGHGVGLTVDESPVVADRFDMPLEENMVIAIEPKCSITGVGTVGVEDTYIVKHGGAVCLTGNHDGLIDV